MVNTSLSRYVQQDTCIKEDVVHIVFILVYQYQRLLNFDRLALLFVDFHHLSPK